MKLSLLLPPKYDERKWTLARQAGVQYAITKAAPELSGMPPPYDFQALKQIKDAFEESGFKLYGLEGDQFDMNPIKLGLPNRDEWIDKYRQMLQNMGRLNIRLLCYNFMAVIGWFRTRTNVQERGGALVSAFHYEDVKDERVESRYQIAEEQLWENLYYFLEAVLPIAEANGIQMALHPDDPPVSPLKGVGRILTAAAAFDHLQHKYPSPSNGITFCQATFQTMGEDLKAISQKWLAQKKIFFVHLRDIVGDRYAFRETFHDNGSTQMHEMIRHYHTCGFDGPLRPDHAPAMYGENLQSEFAGGLSVGYEITGKIYAIGHIKGVCAASDILLE
jgi:mannonate dehydratase